MTANGYARHGSGQHRVWQGGGIWFTTSPIHNVRLTVVGAGDFQAAQIHVVGYPS